MEKTFDVVYLCPQFEFPFSELDHDDYNGRRRGKGCKYYWKMRIISSDRLPPLPSAFPPSLSFLTRLSIRLPAFAQNVFRRRPKKVRFWIARFFFFFIYLFYFINNNSSHKANIIMTDMMQMPLFYTLSYSITTMYSIQLL